jgi:hypothetical protein
MFYKCKLFNFILSFIIIIPIIIFNSEKASAYSSNQIYVAHTFTYYADSSQWRQMNDGWMCGSDKQPYANAWVCTNGKWYYMNNNCYMVTNCWVNNWYVGDDGAWNPNATRDRVSIWDN